MRELGVEASGRGYRNSAGEYLAIERGKIEDIHLSRFVILMRTLGVSANYLLGLQEREEPLEQVEQGTCVHQCDQSEEPLPLHKGTPAVTGCIATPLTLLLSRPRLTAPFPTLQ